MSARAIESIAHALTVSLGIPVDSTAQHARPVREAARRALRETQQESGWFEIDQQAYFYAAYDALSEDLLVAGPYDSALSPSIGVVPGERERERIGAAVASAARGLRLTLEGPQLRLEVSRQMELLSNAIVAVSGELELDVVLRRIVDLARNFAAARYAALGIPGPDGVLETFITAGVSPEEEKKIGHPPVGRGILGMLLKQNRPVRIARMSEHPLAEGFPPNHPRMESFLGVPIITRDGNVVGSLYLTEKRFAQEFSVEDEMIVDLLARHAAVAIENARLYQALQQHQRRLALVLDQLPEAVMMVEADPPRISMMNQEARNLLNLDDELPIPIETLRARFQFFDEEDRPIELDQIALLRTLRTGEVVGRENVGIRTAAGTRRSLLVNSAPLETGGAVKSAISVFQDVTEIRDADRLKDDFLSLVSHELRTPLTAIHGGSQMLLHSMDMLDEETARELLTDIHQESARLASLIQNIVQLAHIRAGRISVECEPVLLRGVANRTVNRFRADVQEREFLVDVAPDAVAMADPNRVDEMLTNVVQNAIKYAPGTTPIEVRGRRCGEWVELAVRDHGPGIPATEVSSAFERFERGSRASSSTPGMGLGLYIVRLLVESQGGHAHLELPEDGGTRVVMTLPAADVEE